jgi:hypothetical protein
MLAEAMPVARRSACRTLRRAAAAAAVALASALALAQASASAANLSANIPLGQMPAACRQESSPECEQWLLASLNAARATLGLSSYRVPADFLSLSADRQVFILTDLDRVAYGYTPISGLSSALDQAAAAGVRQEIDPLPPALEAPWRGFGSDWASTGPLLAYYLWMYDDGYPGANLDCSSPGARGCWGHRRVILGEAVTLAKPEVVGVASGQSARGFAGTALIVSSHPGAQTYYTWTQAEGEGAGAGALALARTEAPRPRRHSRRHGRRAAAGSRAAARSAHRAARAR